MSYHFLNNVCPVCGKPVGSYFYTIIGNKKLHNDCATQLEYNIKGDR